MIDLIIAGAGLAMGAAGMIGGMGAAEEVSSISKQQAALQTETSKAIIAEQQKMNALRKQQMELDATRRQREIVRQSIAARSASLAVATAQGGNTTGSSALMGAYGGISGRTGVNTLGVTQNLEIGRGLFAAQDRITKTQLEAADKNLVLSNQMADAKEEQAFWSGLTSLGGSVMRSAGPLSQMATSAFNYFDSPTAISGTDNFTPGTTYTGRAPGPV